jgi:type IV secretory pathway protease TraF
MLKDEIEAHKGQNVQIMANGILFEGVLIGASDETISLQTPLQWLELPMEQVSWLRGKES